MLLPMTSRLTTEASVYEGKHYFLLRNQNGASLTYSDSEACRHPVEVIGVVAHGHHLRNYCFTSPLDAKYLCELLQVVRGGLTDGENCIAQPTHAKSAQLLIEELDAKLAGEKRNVLDDG